MNQNNQNKTRLCGARVVIVDDDPRLLFSLDYLFSIVCQMDVCLVTGIHGIEDTLCNSKVLKLLIISTSGADKERDALIKAAAGFPNPPFILVIDGTDNPTQRIRAYLSGASDVIRKPVSLLELYLRLRARIADFSVCPEAMDSLEKSDWDTEAFLAEKACLTASEALIAHVLIEGCGRVVSRNELSIAINGRPWELGDRKFDVHVSNLRKKFDTSLGRNIQVTTVHSLGYKLTMDSRFV